MSKHQDHHNIPNDLDLTPYADGTQQRDEAYRQAYADWVASLSPEDRRQLAALGLDRPSIPGAGTGAPSRDMAESSLAACEAEEPGGEALAEGGEEADAELVHGCDPERLHDLLRRLVGELIGQDNARLSLECLALVTGLAYCGDSMTDIARRHHITRAAVSKRCVDLSRSLNLNPSRAMRSLKARKNYRRARLRHLKFQA